MQFPPIESLSIWDGRLQLPIDDLKRLAEPLSSQWRRYQQTGCLNNPSEFSDFNWKRRTSIQSTTVVAHNLWATWSPILSLLSSLFLASSPHHSKWFIQFAKRLLLWFKISLKLSIFLEQLEPLKVSKLVDLIRILINWKHLELNLIQAMSHAGGALSMRFCRKIKEKRFAKMIADRKSVV